MKWIKKVASTPLETIARVIDSLDSGADATTNAPSIHAVNDALELKATTNELLTTKASLEADIATKADKSSMFIVREYSFEYNLAAGDYIQISASDFGITSITGYTPIAFREVSCGSRYMNVTFMHARAGGTVIAGRNTYTQAINNTCTIKLVFARNDVIGA